MQDRQPTHEEVMRKLSASLDLNEAQLSTLGSETSKIWEKLEAYKNKYESAELSKVSLEQELESTRTTSVERKNNLKLAMEKISQGDAIIESLREALSTRESENSVLIRNLAKLEGQLEVLTQLVMRA